MKAIIYADTGKMVIDVVASVDAINRPEGTCIGSMESAKGITTNTVRLAVGAMLAEAHLPASGWTIKVSNELTNDPS